MAFLLRSVPATEIDLEDRFFKISRDIVTDRFRESIGGLGIIDPPLLLEEGGSLRVVFGINRITAALEAGCNEITARVAGSIDPGEYARECAIKSMRNEIGPVGKCRMLTLLSGFYVDRAWIRRWLALPTELIDHPELSEKVAGFTRTLREYLDSRDVSFKTIKELTLLGDGPLGRIASWTEKAVISQNHFRRIAEMAVDVVKRDGSLDGVADSFLEGDGDRREMGEALFREIYRCRYPEYSALRDRVLGIERDLLKGGIGLDFPRYFDGTSFDLTLRIKKDDDPGGAASRAGSIPADLIRALQDLL